MTATNLETIEKTWQWYEATDLTRLVICTFDASKTTPIVPSEKFQEAANEVFKLRDVTEANVAALQFCSRGVFIWSALAASRFRDNLIDTAEELNIFSPNRAISDELAASFVVNLEESPLERAKEDMARLSAQACLALEPIFD